MGNEGGDKGKSVIIVVGVVVVNCGDVVDNEVGDTVNDPVDLVKDAIRNVVLVDIVVVDKRSSGRLPVNNADDLGVV